MENLSVDLLSCIYKRLPTTKDVCNASLVCRKWCFLLWREEEQQALWLPRITQKLESNVVWFNKIFKQTFQSFILKRKLTTAAASTTSIIQLYRDLMDETTRSIRQLAFTHSRCHLYVSTLQNRGASSDVAAASAAPQTHIVEKNDDERCLFRLFAHPSNNGGRYCLYTMIGEVRGDQGFVNGALLMNDQFQYVGAFLDGIPHGEGIMYENGKPKVKGHFVNGQPNGAATLYDENGLIRFEGMWQSGVAHGEGTMYHESVPTQRLFVGLYDNGAQLRGTWTNDDGQHVHTGDNQYFQNRLALETFQRHQCSYTFTKKCHQPQPWWLCKTCYGESSDSGCCYACAVKCHRGHELIPKQNSLTIPKPGTTFFCDCGASGKCIALTTPCTTGICCSCSEYNPPINQDNDQSVDDEMEVVEPVEPVEPNDRRIIAPPEFGDFVRHQLGDRNDLRVFLEVEPLTMNVIGLRLIPRDEEQQPDGESNSDTE